MGRKNWLSSLEKRDLLNQSAVSIETLVRWGEHFEGEGLVHDALAFFDKAQASEQLARIKEESLESGDFFLFARVCRTLGYEPLREEWLLVARRAEELGKFSFAAQGFRRAGDEESAQRSESEGDRREEFQPAEHSNLEA